MSGIERERGRQGGREHWGSKVKGLGKGGYRNEMVINYTLQQYFR